MIYDVYRNLHNGKLSIRAHGGRVVGYAESVTMQLTHFVVSQAGRERVLQERRKNVHAVVRGPIVAVEGFTPRNGGDVQLAPRKAYTGELHTATYNPYRFKSFVDAETLEPVGRSVEVTVYQSGKINYKK